MIKIIGGTFGLKNGNYIVPKTSKDAPFECDKAVEARLVKLGVAVYVNGTKADADDNTGNGETREALIAEYKALGLKGNPAIMRDETLIAKIAEAKNADNGSDDGTDAEGDSDDDNDSDEGTPTFGEDDGVVV